MRRKEERKKAILLGKRKSRDLEGEASGSGTRGRSADRRSSFPFGGDSDNSGLGTRSSTGSGINRQHVPKRVLGKGKAIRGGLGKRS